MSKKKDEDSGENVLFNYLLQQNRPYSSNDIAQNLHKELGKSETQKILDKLVQVGKVLEKAYGKQKIYYIDQNSQSEANPEEIKALENQIEAEERAVKELERDVKEVEAEARKLLDSSTTDDLKKSIEILGLEVTCMKEKLQRFTETTVVVDKKERDVNQKHLNYCVNEWRSRKALCMNSLREIMENCQTPLAELLTEIDITTDEAVGV